MPKFTGSHLPPDERMRLVNRVAQLIRIADSFDDKLDLPSESQRATILAELRELGVRLWIDIQVRGLLQGPGFQNLHSTPAGQLRSKIAQAFADGPLGTPANSDGN